ncbi:ATP synthase F1 subunit gamma [Clostridium sp.]|uniref:ATP synthase F1 subunit gamma n=1 Tax=Clostridium sp. TaxID=1506 RepID=UPI001A53C629|nr:ATP synthase F1 subunit gamma [Clostridium sp.]MBK5235569.1 ATP synthase F1 subunit gamma [Clostridium sp.]
MSGTGLVTIKRRIKSITNTKKITKAMGLVATSKYKKMKGKLDINNNYIFKLDETIKQVEDNYEDDSIYTKGNSSSKIMYIVVTSDSGLCGGFNLSVINALKERLKSNNVDYNVIVVGGKGRNLCKKFNIETVAEYVEIPDMPSQDEAYTIINHALSMYTSEDVGEVHIVYKKLISVLKNEVEIEKLLPLNFDTEGNGSKKYVDIKAIDEKAMFELVSLFSSGKMLNSMLHSKVSENRARMESMGSATNNADDLLEKLNLKYNRLRQSAITQEISEIVGGAEAQK